MGSACAATHPTPLNLYRAANQPSRISRRAYGATGVTPGKFQAPFADLFDRALTTSAYAISDLYEGPAVKRWSRCDLQHSYVSSGGAVRRLVLPGRNALAPVAP